MPVTEKKRMPRNKTPRVRVTQPTVKKQDRAASVVTHSKVQTTTSVDFVKAVRGR
jgi:hypothetical protein